MARKFANVNWDVPKNEEGNIRSWEGVRLSVLMDIRDELQKLNRILGCHNFLDVPHKLDRIDVNTKKRPYVRKKKP
jgi:hypothetical protein